VFCHRLLDPIQWDECSLAPPGFFDKCPLKPLIAKIRVFRHDDLKVGGELVHNVEEEVKHPLGCEDISTDILQEA